jgi:hypothetical protein
MFLVTDRPTKWVDTVTTCSRPRHPNKEIEEAVREAERLGWTVRMSKRGHIWGSLLCPEHTPEGCTVFVNSTPRDPYRHAAGIRRMLEVCRHCHENGVDDDHV